MEVCGQHNIKVAQAILFGSYAFGNADGNSDIDSAIISPDLGHDRFSEAIVLKLLTEHEDTSLFAQPFIPVKLIPSTK